MRNLIKEVLKEELNKNLITEGKGDFIAKTKDLATKNMEKYKIPASITMAQAALESGWGRSLLPSKYNNYFGVKCHGASNCISLKDADGNLSEWRVYSDIGDSFDDHGKFLTKNQRYQELFNLPITDYKSWAEGLQRLNYAGDSTTYADKLIKTIEANDFNQLDVTKQKEKPKPKDSVIGKKAYPKKSNGYVNVREGAYVDSGYFDNLITKVDYPLLVGIVKNKKFDNELNIWYYIKLDNPVDGYKYGWVRYDVVDLI